MPAHPGLLALTLFASPQVPSPPTFAVGVEVVNVMSRSPGAAAPSTA